MLNVNFQHFRVSYCVYKASKLIDATFIFLASSHHPISGRLLGCRAKSADPEQPISNSPDLHPSDLILIAALSCHHTSLCGIKKCVSGLCLRRLQTGSKWFWPFFFLILAALPIPQLQLQKAHRVEHRKLSSAKQSNFILQISFRPECVHEGNLCTSLWSIIKILRAFLKANNAKGKTLEQNKKGKKSILFWVRDGEYNTSVVPSFKMENNLMSASILQLILSRGVTHTLLVIV